MSIDGVCNASWLWRVDWTNVGTIFVSEWYLTYPPLNNHFGSKRYHAAHQWQNGVNPTINWYRRLVSSSGGWRETNVAAYNIRFGCIFYITKSAATDRDGGVWHGGVNNNIQKEQIS